MLRHGASRIIGWGLEPVYDLEGCGEKRDFSEFLAQRIFYT